MTEQPLERRVASDLSAVEIAKLEGRMDKGFAELNGRLDTMISEARAERETRQTVTGDLRKDVDALEVRTRKTEDELAEVKARPVITWAALWTAIASAVTVAGVIVGVVLGVLKALK